MTDEEQLAQHRFRQALSTSFVVGLVAAYVAADKSLRVGPGAGGELAIFSEPGEASMTHAVAVLAKRIEDEGSGLSGQQITAILTKVVYP